MDPRFTSSIPKQASDYKPRPWTSLEAVLSVYSGVKICVIGPSKDISLLIKHVIHTPDAKMMLCQFRFLKFHVRETWRTRPLTLAIMRFSPLYDEESTQKVKSPN